jgi:hypothetical protein
LHQRATTAESMLHRATTAEAHHSAQLSLLQGEVSDKLQRTLVKQVHQIQWERQALAAEAESGRLAQELQHARAEAAAVRDGNAALLAVNRELEPKMAEALLSLGAQHRALQEAEAVKLSQASRLRQAEAELRELARKRDELTQRLRHSGVLGVHKPKAWRGGSWA